MLLRCKVIWVWVLRPGNAPVCGPKNLYECIIKAKESYIVNNSVSRCDCRRQCRQLTYTHTVSQSEFSYHSLSLMQKMGKLTAQRDQIFEKIRRDFASLEVSEAESKQPINNNNWPIVDNLIWENPWRKLQNDPDRSSTDACNSISRATRSFRFAFFNSTVEILFINSQVCSSTRIYVFL